MTDKEFILNNEFLLTLVKKGYLGTLENTLEEEVEFLKFINEQATLTDLLECIRKAKRNDWENRA